MRRRLIVLIGEGHVILGVVERNKNARQIGKHYKRNLIIDAVPLSKYDEKDQVFLKERFLDKVRPIHKT